MPIIPLKCPNCGADLQADSDNPILTCQYCGSSSVMKDAIVHNYIQNTINITAGTVNITGQKDFVIEAGVLKKYQGEAVDVVVPENVSIIGKDAFGGLRIRSVIIPNGVIEIEERAFAGCIALTSITIPDTVTIIGTSAFQDCAALTSVAIPNGVMEINHSVFRGCKSLISVAIPDGVTTIGACAFRDCAALAAITIPDGVAEIIYSAFSGCKSLTLIRIPDSVTRIDPGAFEHCDNLRKIRVPKSFRAEQYCTVFVNSPPGWRMEGVCQWCGGEFNGLFSKTCSKCGRPKDY